MHILSAIIGAAVLAAVYAVVRVVRALLAAKRRRAEALAIAREERRGIGTIIRPATVYVDGLKAAELTGVNARFTSSATTITASSIIPMRDVGVNLVDAVRMQREAAVMLILGNVGYSVTGRFERGEVVSECHSGKLAGEFVFVGGPMVHLDGGPNPLPQREPKKPRTMISVTADTSQAVAAMRELSEAAKEVEAARAVASN